jgi:alpha-L-fucosidase
MGNGKIDPEAIKLFSGIGAWISDNHESIYDTQANPLPAKPQWGDASLSKDRKYLFLHVMQWPVDGELRVDGVTIEADSASFLSPKAADQTISFTQERTTLTLALPAEAIDPYNSVIKVTLKASFPTE